MSFQPICNIVVLSLCNVYEPDKRVIPPCYARNAETGNAFVFNPATLFLHLVCLMLVSFLIYQTNFKEWGISRKQMLLILSLYMISIFCDFLLLSHFIPVTNAAYKFFVPVQLGLWTSTFWSVFILGLMPLFDIRDIRAASYITTALIFLVVFIFSILTAFNAGLDVNTPTVVFFLTIVANFILLFLTLVSQVYVVVKKTNDRFMLGVIAFGVVFFGLALLFMGISPSVCESAEHFIDGIFLSTLFTLLSVMMVYKYWDSLNQKDAEFVQPDSQDNLMERKSMMMGSNSQLSQANSNEPLMIRTQY